MKRILSATLLLTLLVGCSSQQIPMMRQPGMLRSQSAALPFPNGQPAQPSSDEDAAASIAANLYKESLADDVTDGRPLVDVPQQRGGFIYNRLNGMIPWRKLIYPISDRKIAVEFNKPSPPDATP